MHRESTSSQKYSPTFGEATQATFGLQFFTSNLTFIDQEILKVYLWQFKFEESKNNVFQKQNRFFCKDFLTTPVQIKNPLFQQSHYTIPDRLKQLQPFFFHKPKTCPWFWYLFHPTKLFLRAPFTSKRVKIRTKILFGLKTFVNNFHRTNWSSFAICL